jgi:hypothetical protein
VILYAVEGDWVGHLSPCHIFDLASTDLVGDWLPHHDPGCCIETSAWSRPCEVDLVVDRHGTVSPAPSFLPPHCGWNPDRHSVADLVEGQC